MGGRNDEKHSVPRGSLSGLRLIYLSLILLVTPAFGFDPTGKYSYAKKGYTGEMVVSEGTTEVDPNRLGKLYLEVWGQKPLHVTINTVSLTQFHTCNVEASEVTAGRISKGESSINASFSEKEMEAKFSIEFTPQGAAIKVDDHGGSCGLNGDFGGKWTKVSVKKGRRAK